MVNIEFFSKVIIVKDIAIYPSQNIPHYFKHIYPMALVNFWSGSGQSWVTRWVVTKHGVKLTSQHHLTSRQPHKSTALCSHALYSQDPDPCHFGSSSKSNWPWKVAILNQFMTGLLKTKEGPVLQRMERKKMCLNCVGDGGEGAWWQCIFYYNKYFKILHIHCSFQPPLVVWFFFSFLRYFILIDEIETKSNWAQQDEGNIWGSGNRATQACKTSVPPASSPLTNLPLGSKSSILIKMSLEKWQFHNANKTRKTGKYLVLSFPILKNIVFFIRI